MTNLLIKLTEESNDNKRKALLKQIPQIQYTIINRLDNPFSIQSTIDQLLERLTILSAVTLQQPLTAPQID